MKDFDNRPVLDWVIGIVLGAIAFVAYMATLSVGAYPGESAQILTQSSGLFPLLRASHPLWVALAWVANALYMGDDPALPLNVLSALCGAACIAVLYRTVAGVIGAAMENRDPLRMPLAIAPRLAGVGAALALAFSIPFWIVSNRCHWASFHVLLLLIAAWLLYRFAVGGSRRTLLFLAFWYGLGMAEYATFIVFGPLAAIFLISILWRNEELETPLLLQVGLCLFAGLLLYVVSAFAYAGSAGYALNEYGGRFDVLWATWQEQWRLIGKSLPNRGWLITLLLAVAPWLTAVALGRRGLNDEPEWSYGLLHLVLTGLAVAVLINIPAAPWSMLGEARLLVMPYVLTAALFGYLLAYWFLLPRGWWPNRTTGAKAWIRNWFGLLIVIPGLALVLVMPFRNVSRADARPAGLIRAFAAGIVQNLEGRRWLVTRGVFDLPLLVEARRLGVELNIISQAADQSGLLRRYTASMFDEPRRQNLASIGTGALLGDWLADDPAAVNEVAVLADADIWIGAGLTMLPNACLFLGAPSLADVDGARVMAAHERFWEQVLPQLSLTMSDAHPLAGYERYIRQHLGLVANNLGVLMEDLGDADAAYRAYRQAREIDPENISALMNLFTLVQSGYDGAAADEAEAIRASMSTLAGTLDRRRNHIVALSRYYGYVRSPAAFADLGWSWAFSGQPGLAVSGLRRAIGLARKDDQQALKGALAGLFLQQRRDEESEVLFYELLVENPDNHQALLGMARIELGRGHIPRARDYLQRAAAAGVPEPLMDMEWSALHIATGDAPSARERLTRLLSQQPDLGRAWAMLAAIQVQEHDVDGLSETLRRLRRLDSGQEYLVAVVRGHLAMMRDNIDETVAAFEEALALNPRSPQIVEWLLRLELMQGRMDAAAQRLHRLLQLDPQSAFANHVSGKMQAQRGEFERARDSMLTSLNVRPDPIVMNDLAWLLQKMERFEEAETYARAALERNEKFFQAWDTLGVILAGTDRLDEARQALEKALGYAGDNPIIELHLADVSLRLGDRAQAAAIVARVAQQSASLDAEYQELLRRLQDQLNP